MEFKKFAKSSTSGSFATLRNIVCPFARTAAIIIFSVPVTDTPGKFISHPINFFALASMYPFLSSILAPSCSKADK